MTVTNITRRRSSVSAGPDTVVELAPAVKRDRWARRYGRVLVVGDTIVVTAALVAATEIGSQPYTLPMLDERLTISLWLVLGVLATALLGLLSLSGSRAPRIAGVGSAEYRAVGTSTLLAFAGVALVAYVLSIPGLHIVLAIGLTLTLVGLVVERWVARQWLVAERRRGRMTNRVLVVGSEAAAAAMVRDLSKASSAGLHPVGVYTPAGRLATLDADLDLGLGETGSVAGVVEALERVGADTVLISSSNELSPEMVRELSWKLEPGRQHLVVAPSLTDIGGPRIHSRPVAGLPLVHIETPRYTGGKLYTKRAFDIVVSASLIFLLAPVLLVIAMCVRVTSDGPVLFRQKRVGLGGEYFDMLKFRSMYVDAEARLADLQREGAGNEVMFKMKDDPRVTRVGSILRRYSLDELPQLFNVLAGSMSLVGPRPPLEREVQLYSDSVHRRFLVKPGITGLWQVSGRSDLDWDETVRLDLFYVENWTMTGDLLILFKTFRAVVGSQGAY